MSTEQRTEFVAGLRELADFLEANPDLPMSSLPHLTFWLPFRHDDQGSEPDLRRWAAAFRTFEKSIESGYFHLKHFFRGLKVVVTVNRDRVCRKVLKTVTREEWECPSSLLEDGGDSGAPPEAETVGSAVSVQSQQEEN